MRAAVSGQRNQIKASGVPLRNALRLDFLENVTNHRAVLKFPSDEDLNGAAVALMRLQDTYNLDTSSIARGELNGIQYR